MTRSNVQTPHHLILWLHSGQQQRATLKFSMQRYLPGRWPVSFSVQLRTSSSYCLEANLRPQGWHVEMVQPVYSPSGHVCSVPQEACRLLEISAAARLADHLLAVPLLWNNNSNAVVVASGRTWPITSSTSLKSNCGPECTVQSTAPLFGILIRITSTWFSMAQKGPRASHSITG